MSESHKFHNLDGALKVFPDLPWKASAAGDTWVYDEKSGNYETVNDGDYIVRVGDHYEVTDSKPEEAQRATKETAKKIEETLEEDEPSALSE